jgi:phosphatidylserine decarboxylase precursor
VTAGHTPIVASLVELVDAHGWRGRFELAVQQLQAHDVEALAGIHTLDDYLGFLDDMVTWAPREHHDSLLVHDKLVTFHFLLDQPALRPLQSPARPDAPTPPLTPLSAWIVDFARAWGQYLDTTASAAHVDTFRTNAAFRWDDYMPPPSGYLTFNQFFARHVKPGRRPVDAPCDDTVLASPADASFIGQWRIGSDSTIVVEDQTLPLKGLRWSLEQLLAGSPWAQRFAGVIVTHSALRTFDYHRWHAPAAGTVLEARVIQGRAWLDVQVEAATVDGRSVNRIEAVEGTGYQFLQTRGLVVLQTAAGLVACLPVGMAQVSSVVVTAEAGAVLRKGEEMGYFQFGGSDFVMVFDACCKVRLDGTPGQPVRQGASIGSMSRAAPEPTI